MKFPRIPFVPIGLLIFVGLAVACSTTETPVATPDVEATVTASLETFLPQKTATMRPDVYATIQAQLAATEEAAPTFTAEPISDGTPKPTSTPTLGAMVEIVRSSVVRIDTDKGSGSGFIFQMGYPTPGTGQTALVLTNYHVVENANTINVTVNDSQTITGTVLGIDAFHDLAALTICCGQFQTLEIVDTVDPPGGTRTVAFGYPVGIPGESTVTEGIVSGLRYEDGQWVFESGAATKHWR